MDGQGEAVIGVLREAGFGEDKKVAVAAIRECLRYGIGLPNKMHQTAGNPQLPALRGRHGSGCHPVSDPYLVFSVWEDDGVLRYALKMAPTGQPDSGPLLPRSTQQKVQICKRDRVYFTA